MCSGSRDTHDPCLAAPRAKKTFITTGGTVWLVRAQAVCKLAYLRRTHAFRIAASAEKWSLGRDLEQLRCRSVRFGRRAGDALSRVPYRTLRRIRLIEVIIASEVAAPRPRLDVCWT